LPIGATIGSAVVGAGTSLLGANAQKQATDKATAAQKEMYQQTRADLAPYRTAGVQGTNMLMAALPELNSQIKLDQAWLQQQPGYQFALRQGLKGVQNSAAARGLGTSGAALKGAAGFATGLADQTYQNQFSNEMAQRDARFNRLMGTAQLGANAAAQTGQSAIATGQGIANNAISGGNAIAAGLTGAGNALMGGASNYLGYNLAQQQLAQGGNMWRPSGGLF